MNPDRDKIRQGIVDDLMDGKQLKLSEYSTMSAQKLFEKLGGPDYVLDLDDLVTLAIGNKEGMERVCESLYDTLEAAAWDWVNDAHDLVEERVDDYLEASMPDGDPYEEQEMRRRGMV